MTNLEKIEEMMKNDLTLQEKLAAETKRLTDSGEKDLRKISTEAIKATFGVNLTEEELNQIADAAAKATTKATTKLDLDELDNVAGGSESTENAICYALMGALAGGIGGACIGGPVGAPIGVVGGGIAGAVGGAAIMGGVSYLVDKLRGKD